MRIALVAILFAGIAAAPAAPPARAAMQAPGCGSRLAPEADAESFTESADAARLARETGANFVAAATRLCASGALTPANLAAFTKLVVRNAEGSPGLVVYDDAEQGAENLILEYAFAGTAPSEAAIGTAIGCWRDPQRAGCDQGGD